MNKMQPIKTNIIHLIYIYLQIYCKVLMFPDKFQILFIKLKCKFLIFQYCVDSYLHFRRFLLKSRMLKCNNAAKSHAENVDFHSKINRFCRKFNKNLL